MTEFDASIDLLADGLSDTESEEEIGIVDDIDIIGSDLVPVDEADVERDVEMTNVKEILCCIEKEADELIDSISVQDTFLESESERV